MAAGLYQRHRQMSKRQRILVLHALYPRNVEQNGGGTTEGDFLPRLLIHAGVDDELSLVALFDEGADVLLKEDFATRPRLTLIE